MLPHASLRAGGGGGAGAHCLHPPPQIPPAAQSDHPGHRRLAPPAWTCSLGLQRPETPVGGRAQPVGLQETPIQEQQGRLHWQVATDPTRRSGGELTYYICIKKCVACNVLYEQRNVFTSFSGLSSQSNRAAIRFLICSRYCYCSTAWCPWMPMAQLTVCSAQTVTSRGCAQIVIICGTGLSFCCVANQAPRGTGERCWHTGIPFGMGMAGYSL